MNKISRKIVAMITTCIIALGICLPVFAAEPAVAAETNLTHATFLKNNGKNLAFNMGTGVIDSTQSTIDENGIIKVKLQPHTATLIGKWQYTGSITEAYYADANGNPIPEAVNLISNGYLWLDKNARQDMPKVDGKTLKGIHLVLHFDMQPSNPPGMPNPVDAYFTCDEIQLP